MSELCTLVIVLFLANFGFFLWVRSESRKDWLHVDAKLNSSIKSIHEEMKSFHKRLCVIEEKCKINK